MLDRVGKDAAPDAATEAAMSVEVDETAAAVEAAESEADEADEPDVLQLRVNKGLYATR